MCVRVVDALLLKAFDVLRNKGEAKELSVAIYCPTHSLTHKQSHTLKDTNTHTHTSFSTQMLPTGVAAGRDLFSQIGEIDSLPLTD